MSFQDALPALAQLAELAFVGRILLSLLPPGLPGRHGPADLFATWGASHLLGTIALGIEVGLLELAGLRLHPATLLAPWLLLLLARWITLPGAMVPRHEHLSEVPDPLARALRVATPLAVVAGSILAAGPFDRTTLLRLASALALLALTGFGLSAARRAPLGRALCVAALGSVLAWALASSHSAAMPLALHTGAGVSLLVPWLRRGDRRAAALAAIAFAGCTLLGPREAFFGAGGLFVLCLHTPLPSRRTLALFSTGVFVPCAVIGWSLESGTAFDSRTTLLVTVVVALALATRRRFVAQRELRSEPAPASGSPDPTRPQAEAVRDAVLLSLIPLAARGELSSYASLPLALLPLAPMIAVECGLLLVPAERPLALDSSAPSPPEATLGSARR